LLVFRTYITITSCKLYSTSKERFVFLVLYRIQHMPPPAYFFSHTKELRSECSWQFDVFASQWVIG